MPEHMGGERRRLTPAKLATLALWVEAQRRLVVEAEDARDGPAMVGGKERLVRMRRLHEELAALLEAVPAPAERKLAA